METQQITVLLIIAIYFFSMARGWLTQETGVPLMVLTVMMIVGAADTLNALMHGGAEFGKVALLFTAVAVPAKLLIRSRTLERFGYSLGAIIGRISQRMNLPFWLVVPTLCLFCVYLAAMFFHNTTSILVFGSLVALVCQQYKLAAIPTLHGALIASNLGGYSSKWGDTPNIVEASIWGLRHEDFLTQILPINIGFLILLCVIVSLLTKRRIADTDNDSDNGYFESFISRGNFNAARDRVTVDGSLAFLGYTGLLITIGSSILLPDYELIGAAAAIVVCVLLSKEKREETLLALGLQTYLVIFSVFILAYILAHSRYGIGEHLESWLVNGDVISIAVTSYFGTMLTEAASWAAAAAPIVHEHAPTNVAAWALGGGICAGSSSVLTAATAGVLLSQITKDNPSESRVSFGSYFLFGTSVSLLMLVYYIVVLSLIW